MNGVRLLALLSLCGGAGTACRGKAPTPPPSSADPIPAQLTQPTPKPNPDPAADPKPDPDPDPDPDPNPDPALPPDPSYEVRELTKTIGLPKTVKPAPKIKLIDGVPQGSPGGVDGFKRGDPAKEHMSRKLPAAVLDAAIYKPFELRSTQDWFVPVGTTRSRVRFCVDGAGKTFEIATPKGRGNARVDEAFRKLVANWRFKPFVDGDLKMMPCVTVEFTVTRTRPDSAPPRL